MTRPHPNAALLAGGGSGGHVFPALAVGGELARRGWQVGYAGAATGMEARLVGERGLPFHALPARPVVGRGLVDRLLALWTLLRSALAARRLVRRLGIAVVVGTGGYVSAPAVLGAALAGTPALLVEPNAAAGLANRWLSRWAAEAAVAWERAGAELRCPSVVTGVPVRSEFAAVEPRPAPAGAPRILVLGGSQGSLQMNLTLPPALAAALSANGAPPPRVLHQAGAGKVDATLQAYRAAGLAAVACQMPDDPAPQGAARVVPFVADTAAAMADADLVVSRAGAITTAELCTAGRAALLLPLTGAAGGHQVANARALADAGAARVVETRATDAADDLAAPLAAALGELLAEPARLAGMAAAARALGRPDAAAAIADRAEALAARRAERRAA
jgi:UDP-N-acetylglucosamine--N-acetylmuramyl-(pentapeptide) pyrophosphoryl-undecaprenol N-acetylglucosamine transferase